MIEDDNDNKNDFMENNSVKSNSNIASYSISAFNEDASTYLGVKSFNEEKTILILKLRIKRRKIKK